MTDSLVPVVMLIGMSTTVAASLIVISAIMGRPKKSVVDKTPYECGSTPFERTETHRFSMHFYLVAMLFILFDIEAAFLIPWAVTFGDATNKMFVLGEMVVFLGILIVGFAYLWWRGALEWE
ncbi:MAG: NADH-quinone oxidoreductase subunit A [Actinomycetia bacterium]|nr:NADH-quinone oxidoreductase subunit A [Actinomycetes bacterium]